MAKKITILGAGISGLACAYELIKKGECNVHVYEAIDVPGGMARTEKYKKTFFDLGPHLYHTPDQDTVDYWKQNFKDLLVEKQLWSKNFKYGKYIDYPLGWTTLDYFDEEIREKIKKEIEEYSKSELKNKATNFKEYIQGLVGPTLQEMFFEKYPKKLWGISSEELSANWAPKKISFREKYESFYYNQFCAVGRFGSGVIPEKMASEILKNGGKISYNKKIKRIDITDNKRISKLYFEDETNAEISEDEIVISTLPITSLSNFLGIKNNLKFRAVVMVFFIVKKPYVLPSGIDFIYYDADNMLFHRITEQKKYHDEGLPKESSIICLEIAADKEDGIYKMEDKKLIEMVKKQLILTGLAKDEEISEGFVRRLPEVYPMQTAGFEFEKARVMSELEKLSNLFIIGSAAEFGYFDIQILFCKARDLIDLITKPKTILQDKKETRIVELNKSIGYKEIKIGPEDPVFIIAEAGMNHNGSLELGKKLIHEAKNAGCNAIKFQSFKAESRVSSKVKSARYAEKITDIEDNFYEMFKKLELGNKDHKELFDYAKKIGISIFSTPFDEENADMLEKLGVEIFKISSMDLGNIPLIRHIAKKGKPIILSTGMGTLGEIEDALNAIKKENNPNVVLLHCISAYPCPPEKMNLKAINTLQEVFKIPVGLSDHSIGNAIPLSAVTRGAVCIEKHFTLDNKLEGPDHIFSANPAAMKEMVESIRMIEKAQGNGKIERENIEYNTAQLFKKSIFAKRDIGKNTVITADMLAVKGPAVGIPPKFMDIIVGKKLKKDIPADFPISWEDI